MQFNCFKTEMDLVAKLASKLGRTAELNLIIQNGEIYFNGADETLNNIYKKLNATNIQGGYYDSISLKPKNVKDALKVFDKKSEIAFTIEETKRDIKLKASQGNIAMMMDCQISNASIPNFQSLKLLGELNPQSFNHYLSNALNFAHTKCPKVELECLHLTSNEGKLVLQSTDTRALFISQTEENLEIKSKLLHFKLAKILNALLPKAKSLALLEGCENSIAFKVDDLLISPQAIIGKFPEVDKIPPKDSKAFEATLTKHEALALTEQLKPVSNFIALLKPDNSQIKVTVIDDQAKTEITQLEIKANSLTPDSNQIEYVKVSDFCNMLNAMQDATFTLGFEKGTPYLIKDTKTKTVAMPIFY